MLFGNSGGVSMTPHTGGFTGDPQRGGGVFGHNQQQMINALRGPQPQLNPLGQGWASPNNITGPTGWDQGGGMVGIPGNGGGPHGGPWVNSPPPPGGGGVQGPSPALNPITGQPLPQRIADFSQARQNAWLQGHYPQFPNAVD